MRAPGGGPVCPKAEVRLNGHGRVKASLTTVAVRAFSNDGMEVHIKNPMFLRSCFEVVSSCNVCVTLNGRENTCFVINAFVL